MATRKQRAADAPPEAPVVDAASDAPEVVMTPARVLAACSLGRPNDVIELDAEGLAAALSAGLVDPHPDAVAAAAALR